MALFLKEIADFYALYIVLIHEIIYQYYFLHFTNLKETISKIPVIFPNFMENSDKKVNEMPGVPDSYECNCILAHDPVT